MLFMGAGLEFRGAQCRSAGLRAKSKQPAASGERVSDFSQGDNCCNDFAGKIQPVAKCSAPPRTFARRSRGKCDPRPN